MCILVRPASLSNSITDLSEYSQQPILNIPFLILFPAELVHMTHLAPKIATPSSVGGKYTPPPAATALARMSDDSVVQSSRQSEKNRSQPSLPSLALEHKWK